MPLTHGLDRFNWWACRWWLWPLLAWQEMLGGSSPTCSPTWHYKAAWEMESDPMVLGGGWVGLLLPSVPCSASRSQSPAHPALCSMEGGYRRKLNPLPWSPQPGSAHWVWVWLGGCKSSGIPPLSPTVSQLCRAANATALPLLSAALNPVPACLSAKLGSMAGVGVEWVEAETRHYSPGQVRAPTATAVLAPASAQLQRACERVCVHVHTCM